MRDGDQEILIDIANGLLDMERTAEEQRRQGKGPKSYRMDLIDVVLLDEDQVILGHYSLGYALHILAEELTQDVAAKDVRTRKSAEVWPSSDQPAWSQAKSFKGEEEAVDP